MATASYDVIIIGGGINGAATAASVAARGYRTLVLEQDDFASGTTSALDEADPWWPALPRNRRRSTGA